MREEVGKTSKREPGAGPTGHSLGLPLLKQRFGDRQQFCGTEPKLWHLQVDSVRTEVNRRTPPGVQNSAWWLGGKPVPPWNWYQIQILKWVACM